MSFAVGVALIAFLATRFELDWSRTLENVRTMNPLLYLVAGLCYYLSFGFRGLRWRILSQSAGIETAPDRQLPTVVQYSQFIIIGWFVNSVAWLRLGDAYRAYTLSDETRSSFSWSLGTIFAERIMDMATIFGLMLVGAIAFSLTSDFSSVVYIVGAAFGMAALLGVVMLTMRGYGPRIAQFLPARIRSSYKEFQNGTLGSFESLRLPLLLSIVGWLLEIGRLYFVVQALGFDIPLSLVLVAALGHAILSTVPTPGGIGAVEPGVTGILILGMTRHDAASVALLDRSITYLSVIVIGGIIFLIWNINRSRRKRTPLSNEEPAQ